MAAAGDSDGDASKAIARAAAALTYDDLPALAVDAAKRGILDTLGVCLAATAAAEEEIGPVRAVIRAESCPGGVRALGHGWPLTLSDAVFWFGALAHALDYDDVAADAAVHPSAPVVACVLPLAQRTRRVSGRDALTAVAAGQDLIVRIGLSLRRPAADYGWLPATPNTFGAALASAMTLGLDADGIRHSLGLALHQTSGTMQAAVGVGSAYRAVREAFNARAGLLAAQLALNGMKGDDAVFDGKYGLFRQFFGGDYDPGVLVDGVGRDMLGRTIGLKAWPCCGYSQFFLTAVDELLSGQTIQPDDIESITLVGRSDLLPAQCEPRALRVAPKSSIDAKFSLPFQMGKYIAHRAIGVGDFLPSGLHDPDAIDIAERVRWRMDDTLQTDRGFGPGVVEVKLRDGRSVSAHADQAYGHVARPLSWDHVVAKFRDCIANAAVQITPAIVDQVVEAVAGLESLADAGVLVTLLSPTDAG